MTASPIGDSAPVLLALDATVTLASLTGERVVPLAEFFTGYRQTVLAAGEILVTISLPRNLPGRCVFYKVSKRREMDISAVSAAIRLVVDDEKVITDARLAYGGVAATPARAMKTERLLVGRNFQDAAGDEVLQALAAEFQPLDDLRASADYRKALIRDLFLKALSGAEDVIAAPVIQPLEPRDLPHESAAGHVTGEALYTQDLGLRRHALQVWLVRSEHAHARLTRVDVSRARNAPGVRAVLTAGDIPGHNNTGCSRDDEPLFASDLVQFHGQVIAAVVAGSLEQARLAAQLVVVEYEPLDPLLGIEAALEKQSFHTDPHTLRRGAVDEALRGAPRVIEGDFHIGGQEHFYLESQAALAEPDGDGVFVFSSSQHPSETQMIVSEVLGWPKHRVVVESPRMGGGFGEKKPRPIRGLRSAPWRRTAPAARWPCSWTGITTWNAPGNVTRFSPATGWVSIRTAAWRRQISSFFRRRMVAGPLAAGERPGAVPSGQRLLHPARPFPRAGLPDQRHLAHCIPGIWRSTGDARDRGNHRPDRRGTRACSG